MAPYREYRLGPPLDSSVECVWVLSGVEAVPQPGSNIQRIPPDGCVEAIFHLRDRFCELQDGGSRVVQPGAFIVGIWTKPIVLEAPAAFETVGIRFRPGCAARFTDGAGRLTNQAIESELVWGRSAAALRERLAEDDDDGARLAAIGEFLMARLRRSDALLLEGVQRIMDTSGRTSVDALSRHLGVGHRRLERAFVDHVGVPAKTLCRIVRFQSALRRRTPASAAGWADLAAACGYSDQSHLIRDFRQFAGQTPASLAAAEPSLADYFRRR